MAQSSCEETPKMLPLEERVHHHRHDDHDGVSSLTRTSSSESESLYGSTGGLSECDSVSSRSPSRTPSFLSLQQHHPSATSLVSSACSSSADLLGSGGNNPQDPDDPPEASAPSLCSLIEMLINIGESPDDREDHGTPSSSFPTSSSDPFVGFGLTRPHLPLASKPPKKLAALNPDALPFAPTATIITPTTQSAATPTTCAEQSRCSGRCPASRRPDWVQDALEGARCNHYGKWKRQRARNGVMHMLCTHCGTKWFAPMLAGKTQNAIAPL